MTRLNSSDPYQTLANAIILQAVDDYREANKKLAKRRRNPEAKKMKDECLKFFKSNWFSALTSIDAGYLIRKLDEEVNHYDR